MSRDIYDEEPDVSGADAIWEAAQMQAMAEQLHKQARAVLGIETFIDTTPVLSCGCRQGMCTGHALPPALGMPEGRTYKHGEPHLPLFAFGLTAAEIVVAPERHEIRDSGGVRRHLVNGAVCGCTAPPPAPPGAHGLTCPVFLQSTRAALYQQELKRLTDAEIAEAESSGRPEKEDKPPPPPGIPLWDEDKHAALAEMSGPLQLLPEDRLPAYDAVPPGCCTGCHLPVRPGVTTCFYCDLARRTAAVRGAEQVEDILAGRRRTCDHGGPRLRFARDGRCARCGQFTPARRAQRVRAYPFFLLGLALTLFIAGLHSAPWLCLAAVLFAACGLNGLRSRR